MTDRQNHQGVVLAVAAYQYAAIDDLFDNAAKHDEDPFFLILNELEDPHNLGAIIRTCEAAGEQLMPLVFMVLLFHGDEQ